MGSLLFLSVGSDRGRGTEVDVSAKEGRGTGWNEEDDDEDDDDCGGGGCESVERGVPSSGVGEVTFCDGIVTFCFCDCVGGGSGVVDEVSVGV